MRLKHQITRVTVAWGALLAFMMLFRPQQLPVVGLIMPFVLLFAAFYSLWLLCGALWARYYAVGGEWRPHRQLGVALCTSAVLLIVLQSLGQLTLRDIVTLVAILSLGYLYLARSRFSLPKQ